MLRELGEENVEGEFVIFPGFEVHSCAHGDRNILYRDIRTTLRFSTLRIFRTCTAARRTPIQGGRVAESTPSHRIQARDPGDRLGISQPGFRTARRTDLDARLQRVERCTEAFPARDGSIRLGRHDPIWIGGRSRFRRNRRNRSPTALIPAVTATDCLEYGRRTEPVRRSGTRFTTGGPGP